MFGWKNQFQTGIYIFMKIHNMICPLTFAGTVWISYTLLQIMHPQYMDISDIFYLHDVIATASNEDIPKLEDVLQL